MKAIISLPILFVRLQCSDQDKIAPEKPDKQFLNLHSGVIPAPISVESFTDLYAKSKIGSHFESRLETRQAQSRIQNDRLKNIKFDFAEAKQFNFSQEINAKAIAFSSPNSDSKVIYDFIAYVDKANSHYEHAIIRKSSKLDGENHFKLEFFTDQHDFLEGVEFNNGVLTRLSNASSNRRGWGACVKGKFDDMTDGSVVGGAAGLTCMAFGVECAVGIGVGCLIAWAIL